MQDPAIDEIGHGADTSTPTDTRERRLSRSLSGTNLARAGDYNLRTVLQAIRISSTTTRVDIAQQTGLTAPTIANITSRLIEMSLVKVTGRKQGGRGQPALQLEVEPDGAFAIGLNVDRDHLTLVILDLAGVVRARASRDMAFALPEDVAAFVREHLDAALAEGAIDRTRILGVGVAMPDDLGCIALPGRPGGYGIWTTTDLTRLLGDILPWPIHCDNDAAAAALGEAEYGSGFDNPSFFYLLVSAGLGGGVVMDRTYHRGANARSGEIGLMPDPTAGRMGATIQDTVSVSSLLERLHAAGHHVDVHAIPDAAAPVVDAWLHDAVRSLTGPLIAINCLFDPDAVLIGGRLPMSLIERMADALSGALAAHDLPSHTRIVPAAMAQDGPAIGAAILPFLDHLLPSDAILIQAGR